MPSLFVLSDGPAGILVEADTDDIDAARIAMIRAIDPDWRVGAPLPEGAEITEPGGIGPVLAEIDNGAVRAWVQARL